MPRQSRYRLENDPSCGLTTGGREECWWDCGLQRVDGDTYLLPPSCLADCFPTDHCLSSLLADYQAAGGICQGGYMDRNYPGVFPVSDQTCEFDVNQFGWTTLVRGLCSERTQELLQDQENCIIPIYSQKPSIKLTTENLIRSMCDQQIWSQFYPRLERKAHTKRSVHETRKKRFFNLLENVNEQRKTLQPRRSKRLTDGDDAEEYHTKLIPIEEIGTFWGPTIAIVPPLENTKHRYPWICSLRSVGQQNSHICGVTLLSRPPGPTVLVTSAHCVNICKSEEGRQVPNCCCPNVGPGLCTDTQDCGTNATTVEMTGEEAEVKCGEWNTDTDTEEEYGVILSIKKIVIHPEFNISRGEMNSQFVAGDIAVLKVEDRNFEVQSRTHNIFPACLPSNNQLTTTAVHSGWSRPPPLDYVTNYVSPHLPYYQEFSKQWHYAMKVTNCEDPQAHVETGAPLNYPTNSYYPPGTVCAVEKLGEFCPTSGESGSPLMVKNDEGRMVAEGINSFIKVSKIFYFHF